MRRAGWELLQRPLGSEEGFKQLLDVLSPERTDAIKGVSLEMPCQ
jgi:hypothetical protein